MENVKLDLIKTAERWVGYSNEYLKEARSHFYNVISSSLTLGTFLIGFDLIWVQLYQGSLTCGEKFLFIVSLVLILLSLFFGVWSILKMNDFLNKSGGYYANLSDNLYNYMSKNNISSVSAYPQEIYENMPEIEYGMTPWQSKVQLLFLAISLIISVFLMVLVVTR